MTTPDLDLLPAIRRDADGPVFRAPREERTRQFLSAIL